MCTRSIKNKPIRIAEPFTPLYVTNTQNSTRSRIILTVVQMNRTKTPDFVNRNRDLSPMGVHRSVRHRHKRSRGVSGYCETSRKILIFQSYYIVYCFVCAELREAVHKAKEEEIQIPFGVGVAGTVAETKEVVNIKNAYQVHKILACGRVARNLSGCTVPNDLDVDERPTTFRLDVTMSTRYPWVASWKPMA